MKKFISICILFFFASLATFAQNDGWKSHTQCENGEVAKPTKDGPFSATWSTTSSTQKEGTQNHYNTGAKGEGNIGVAKAGAGIEISRDGEKKTTNSSTTTTHTLNYDCVKPEDKK